jgi:CBS-domain-containing membrane protein
MICRHALVTDVISAGPENTLADALALLEHHGIRALPIVDETRTLVGYFSFEVLLSRLLPGAITLEHHGLEDTNLRLDYLMDAEEKVAQRLGELLPVKLAEVMGPPTLVVHAETPLWEGIRQLVRHGSPIPVVEVGSNELLGLLSVQSVMGELAKLVGQDPALT